MKTHQDTNDDSVTVAEALKRLGTQNIKPARQSFYTAVKAGKILDVTDKENNPESKLMVSWSSVQDYVSAGGFAPRRRPAEAPDDSGSKPSGTDQQEPPEQPVQAEQPEQPVQPQQPQQPQQPEQPEQSEQSEQHEQVSTDPVAPASRSTDSSPTTTQQVPSDATIREPASRPDRVKPKQGPNPDHDRVPKKTDKKGKGKKTGSHSIRGVKNSLRQYGFDEAKNLRDWLDNRLLTVLRPAPTMAMSDDGKENPQQA